jgi:hypothetical protein
MEAHCFSFFLPPWVWASLLSVPSAFTLIDKTLPLGGSNGNHQNSPSLGCNNRFQPGSRGGCVLCVKATAGRRNKPLRNAALVTSFTSSTSLALNKTRGCSLWKKSPVVSDWTFQNCSRPKGRNPKAGGARSGQAGTGTEVPFVETATVTVRRRTSTSLVLARCPGGSASAITGMRANVQCLSTTPLAQR